MSAAVCVSLSCLTVYIKIQKYFCNLLTVGLLRVKSAASISCPSRSRRIGSASKSMSCSSIVTMGLTMTHFDISALVCSSPYFSKYRPNTQVVWDKSGAIKRPHSCCVFGGRKRKSSSRPLTSFFG